MVPLIKKAKNNFLLGLNKNIYKKEIVDKVVAEEKSWVTSGPMSKDYYQVQLKTKKIEEVLAFANYILYQSKTSLKQ